MHVQSAYIMKLEKTKDQTSTQKHEQENHTDTQRVASQAQKVQPLSTERQTGEGRRLQARTGRRMRMRRRKRKRRVQVHGEGGAPECPPTQHLYGALCPCDGTVCQEDDTSV